MELLEMLEKMPENVRAAASISIKARPKGRVDAVLVCGMGASGISGDILRDYLKHESKVPIVVDKSYDIPNFVGKNTLVLIISYSGKTAETMSMLREAKRRGAKIVIISSKSFGRGSIKVPENYFPRMALPFLFFSSLAVLEKFGIIKKRSSDAREAAALLEKFDRKTARKIAEQIRGKTPIIYGPESLSSVVLRWQTQLNENSKVLAHTNVFTELDHNEIESHLGRGLFVIILRGREKAPVRKEIRASEQIIHNYTEIKAKGDSALARMLYLICFGDWVSYYLSQILGQNPSRVPNIDRVKRSIR